jgi:hypothetical protein
MSSGNSSSKVRSIRWLHTALRYAAAALPFPRAGLLPSQEFSSSRADAVNGSLRRSTSFKAAIRAWAVGSRSSRWMASMSATVEPPVAVRESRS